MPAIRLRAMAVLLLATLATAAQADDSRTSIVNNVTVQTGTTVALFSIADTTNNVPACSVTRRFAFDLSNAQGQAMFATVETAMITSHPMAIIGTGDCNIWGDSETVRYVSLL